MGEETVESQRKRRGALVRHARAVAAGAQDASSDEIAALLTDCVAESLHLRAEITGLRRAEGRPPGPPSERVVSRQIERRELRDLATRLRLRLDERDSVWRRG